MHGVRLWLLSTLWPQVIALSNPLPPVDQYEVVWPKRLPGPRTRRALPSHWVSLYCPFMRLPPQNLFLCSQLEGLPAQPWGLQVDPEGLAAHLDL